MYKLNKIRGFIVMPIIIGASVLAVGVLSGLAYEYKNNQAVLSSVDKNNLLAQVYGGTAARITSFTVTDPGSQGILPVTISWSTSIPTNAELTCKGSSTFIQTSAQIFISEDNKVVECNKEGTGRGGTGTVLASYLSQDNNVITVKSKGNSQYIPTEFCLNLYKDDSVSATDGRCISVTFGPDQQTPSIKVLSPNGGERIAGGTSYSVSVDNPLGLNFTPYLFKGGMVSSNKSGKLYGNLLGSNSFIWEAGNVIIDSGVATTVIASDYYICLLDTSGNILDCSDAPFTITAPVVETFSIISPSSGEQLTAGQTYNVRWSGAAGDNSFYSVYLIGGIDMSSWSLGTAYQTEKDVNSISVTIPSNVPMSSSYQIRFIGKAWQSDGNFFTITAPQPTCAPSTSCVSQYCQYGGDLKKCTVNKADCSTSSYTTGGCKSTPSISTVCDSTAKAIVDSVGGCTKIDRSLYSNIYDVCCVPVVVTEKSLLSMLNTALADRFIDKQEEAALLTALNSYLK